MEALAILCALLCVILAFMAAQWHNSRKWLQKRLEQIAAAYGVPPKRAYGAEELSHIGMYWKKHPEEGQIDAITWNDLHMDRLYQRMNACLSSAGDEYLYYRLRTPAKNLDALLRLEEMVRFFQTHEAERKRLQRVFFQLGRTGRHSLYEYLDQLALLGEQKSGRYFFWDFLVLLSVGCMFVSLPTGLFCLFLTLCHNLISYLKEYRAVEPYVSSFAYVRRLLFGAQALGKEKISAIEEELEQVRKLQKGLRGFWRSSGLLSFGAQGGGSPFDVLFDYLRMLLYLDLICFNRALQELCAHVDEVDGLVTLMGQLECAIAVGSFRESLKKGFCVPELTEVLPWPQGEARPKNPLRGEGEALSETLPDGDFLQAEGLYHPLLAEPVENDVRLRRGMLLTGSNASGKSTFLRAVAVNALMAQTIHTCAAKRCRAPFCRVYSSISLQDDLSAGDSYYMAEIKAVKRILDQAERADGRPILCFVDEVLRGTNTAERIAASTQILRKLAKGPVLCLAATHDVELTELLQSEYENYHFAERIAGQDISFPYKLMKGPAATRNAIALLRILGYEEEITEKAEAMAERFLREGRWR